MILTAKPAYGRDYKTKATLIKDWNDNKDFVLLGAPFESTNHRFGYFNKSQASLLKKSGIAHIHIRYRQNRLIHVIKL